MKISNSVKTRKKLKIVSELMTSCLSPKTSFPSLKVIPQKLKLTKHKGEKKWRTECHLSIVHSKCEKAKVRVKKLVGLCFLSPLAGSRNNCVNFERWKSVEMECCFTHILGSKTLCCFSFNGLTRLYFLCCGSDKIPNGFSNSLTPDTLLQKNEAKWLKEASSPPFNVKKIFWSSAKKKWIEETFR